MLWRAGRDKRNLEHSRDGGSFAQASVKGSSSLGSELIEPEAEITARFGDLHSHSRVFQQDFTSEKREHLLPVRQRKGSWANLLTDRNAASGDLCNYRDLAPCKEKTKSYSSVDGKIQPDQGEKEEQQADALKLSNQEYRRKQS